MILINSFLAFGGTPPIDLTPNLISYWKTDDAFTGGGADTAVDSWGSNNGTCSSVTSSTGKVGNCANMNAGSDQFNIPTASGDFDFGVNDGDKATDTPFSLSVWNNIDGFDTGSNYLINSVSNVSSEVDWIFRLEYTSDTVAHLRFYIDDGSGTNSIQITSTTSSTKQVWKHYVATYDGSGTKEGMKVYMDGVLQGVTRLETGTYTGMINASTKITVGKRGWQNGVPINLIDEIKIFDKELTQAEIDQDYANGLSGNPLV